MRLEVLLENIKTTKIHYGSKVNEESNFPIESYMP